MNRVVASIIWASVALGCAAEDPLPTSTTATNKQVFKCKPEAPFCDAEMPQAPPWKGEQAPPVDRGNGYAVLIEMEDGRYLAALSDVKSRKIVWARTLEKQQLGAFIDTSGIDDALDIVRPPPRPPVGPGGGNWNARFSLERSFRGILATQQSSDALDNYPCDPIYCPKY